jgi:hypothetical protein
VLHVIEGQSESVEVSPLVWDGFGEARERPLEPSHPGAAERAVAIEDEQPHF